jgi:P27 family predicted phage terminase small subunit
VPQPEQVKLRCPSWLSPEGRKLWRQLYPRLFRLGLATELDAESLAIACQAYAEFEIATKLLQKDGRLLTAPTSGYQMPHPAVALQRSAWATWLKYASAFGLTPATRGRITVPEPPGKKSGPARRFEIANRRDDLGINQQPPQDPTKTRHGD